MNRYLLPSLLIAAGMAVVVMSIAWPRLAPNPNWTPAQAEAYNQALRELNRSAAAGQPEDDAAFERYQQLRQQREAALGDRVWASLLLQMLGVGLALIGAVWLIQRQNEAQDAREAAGESPSKSA